MPLLPSHKLFQTEKHFTALSKVCCEANDYSSGPAWMKQWDTVEYDSASPSMLLKSTELAGDKSGFRSMESVLLLVLSCPGKEPISFLLESPG